MYPWEEGMPHIEPYVPGEQPKGDSVIKLNTNENPYPPAPAIKAILEGYDIGRLRKYPEPTMSVLRSALADYHKVDCDNVFVGVGSDDVLAMAFMTFFKGKNAPVVFSDITYSFYEVWARLFGIDVKLAPLKEDFSIDTGDYVSENAGIVIANPNAPTGLDTGINDLVYIIESNPASVIIIDEAYIDFGGESVIELTHKYNNLLVVRTFSKSRSLAGSRIGYAVGSTRLIEYLFATRDSFNSYTMDSITMDIGVAAVEDEAYFRSRIDAIVTTREKTKERLAELGFSFPDSKANFVFAKHNSIRAEEIFNKLKEKNIYTRYFNKPLIDNYLRISIGTDEQMDKLIEALKEIVG